MGLSTMQTHRHHTAQCPNITLRKITPQHVVYTITSQKMDSKQLEQRYRMEEHLTIFGYCGPNADTWDSIIYSSDEDIDDIKLFRPTPNNALQHELQFAGRYNGRSLQSVMTSKTGRDEMRKNHQRLVEQGYGGANETICIEVALDTYNTSKSAKLTAKKNAQQPAWRRKDIKWKYI